MSTGNGKAPTAAANRAKDLRFDGDRIVVALRDGREIHVPLRLFPTLRRATTAQREDWEMMGAGQAFHWRQLDLDLSVEGLIRGLREAIPPPPKRARYSRVLRETNASQR